MKHRERVALEEEVSWLVRAALRTCLAAFLITVLIMFALYCVWVLTSVYAS